MGLSRLGFQGKASKATFYEYIKSLRKLGTPFDRRSIYYVVPDSLLAEIIKHRKTIYRHFRRAYIERARGLGAFDCRAPF